MRDAGHPEDQQHHGEEGCLYASHLLSTASPRLLGFASGQTLAAEHVVKMMNDNGKGEFMTFEPSVVEAAPGDTIKFVAVDQFHNAETLPEIWPDGAATFKGELSKDVTLTVEKEGVYGVKCEPHFPDGHDGLRRRRQAGQCRPDQGLPAAGMAAKRYEAWWQSNSQDTV